MGFLQRSGKVLGKVILQRLKPILDSVIPEAQCGFRNARSTIDMIFTIRQLQEISVEQNIPILIAFIDFTKAFDTVNRQCLWSLLHWISTCIMSLTEQLHTGMMARVRYGGTSSENKGVKQGCVLVPSLFAAVLELFHHNPLTWKALQHQAPKSKYKDRSESYYMLMMQHWYPTQKLSYRTLRPEASA
ncbi:uncharacterized protein LOC125033210 [Penaeus chinensis]|uniref:uncharacterized protein LOC125033210 n=1 Tax=Penaeus chinensis TaxID=139456 RepID=UPI001FB5BCB9|nr:uncharacterized protein LOC125033210 [Penaeus chinensis]